MQAIRASSPLIIRTCARRRSSIFEEGKTLFESTRTPVQNVSRRRFSLPPPFMHNSSYSCGSESRCARSPHHKNSLPFSLAWSRVTRFGESVSFPREIVWLGGAPGAGKGTNSENVATARGFTCKTIVMSSLLSSPECEAIKAHAGMVDDTTAFEVLLKELSKPEYRDGVVVDGFPRTQAQVDCVTQLHDRLAFLGNAPDYSFVMLNVPEHVSIGRQLSRGAETKNVNASRALQGLAPLEERATDFSHEFAYKRYQLFSDQLSSLTHLGERFAFHVIDAEGTHESVKGRISSTLGFARNVEKLKAQASPLNTIPEIDAEQYFSPSYVRNMNLSVPRLSLPAYL